MDYNNYFYSIFNPLASSVGFMMELTARLHYYGFIKNDSACEKTGGLWYEYRDKKNSTIWIVRYTNNEVKGLEDFTDNYGPIKRGYKKFRKKRFFDIITVNGVDEKILSEKIGYARIIVDMNDDRSTILFKLTDIFDAIASISNRDEIGFEELNLKVGDEVEHYTRGTCVVTDICNPVYHPITRMPVQGVFVRDLTYGEEFHVSHAKDLRRDDVVDEWGDVKKFNHDVVEELNLMIGDYVTAKGLGDGEVISITDCYEPISFEPVTMIGVRATDGSGIIMQYKYREDIEIKPKPDWY